MTKASGNGGEWRVGASADYFCRVGIRRDLECALMLFLSI